MILEILNLLIYLACLVILVYVSYTRSPKKSPPPLAYPRSSPFSSPPVAAAASPPVASKNP